MELTNAHIEAIREAARSVKYGSVTINISESSNKLELNVQHRIRLDRDAPKFGTKPKGKT
jgi:hypothetical protein